MVEYLKNKYALTDNGAKDLIKATLSCALTDISFMFPVGLLYFVIKAMLLRIEGKITTPYPLASYIILSIIFIALIFIFQRFQYNSTFLASYKESSNQRVDMAEKLRKIPLSFFFKKNLSDLTTTIMKDCAGLETAFSHFIPQFFGSTISVIIVGIGLLSFNWKLGISLLWVIPASLLLINLGKNRVKRAGKESNDINLANADNIQECIENIKELKSYNQQQRYLKQLENNLDYEEKSHVKTELTNALFVVTSQMLLRVGLATMILVGSSLIINDEINFLTFLVFLIAASRIFDPFAMAIQNLAAIFATELKVDRMKNIHSQKMQFGINYSDFKNYDIEFNNVSFSYDDNENVLNNVSFTAKQGEITALIGPSGGGKSTVAKLVARFWDINEGSIKIGKNDISNIEPETLLKNFSIVFQDVVLFNNTVMENIRIGRRGASNEDVIKVAKIAQCDEFINQLPQKYNTLIGENGSTLSGGERQRISIARALLKDAPIVLLDEATASLDVENESKVQNAISALIKNKTVLVIAHRMRTIANANHIIALKNGRIVEEGNHQSLINKNGLYNKLWKLQTKSSKWKI